MAPASKPRKPLRRGGFQAKLITRKPECLCWSCLRAQGLTPPRGEASRYTEYPTGAVHRVDNGELDHQANKAKEEAEKAAKIQSQP